MFKTLTFLKRRPDLSVEEFRRYYEEKHAPLGIRLMPQACRYFRRYTTPLAYPMTGDVLEAEFDVVTEVWCETREIYEQMLSELCAPEVMAIIAEDEQKFIDQSKTKLFYVEEYGMTDGS